MFRALWEDSFTIHPPFGRIPNRRFLVAMKFADPHRSTNQLARLYRGNCGFFSAAASFAGSHRETKIVGGFFLRFLDLQWVFLLMIRERTKNSIYGKNNIFCWHQKLAFPLESLDMKPLKVYIVLHFFLKISAGLAPQSSSLQGDLWVILSEGQVPSFPWSTWV